MNKLEQYNGFIKELALLVGRSGKYRTDLIGKMALVAALIKREWTDLVFVDFYRHLDNNLHIGPYQGELAACTPIPMGKGICGTAAEQKETVIVDDVLTFPNYIACDSETRSEIVLPVFLDGEVIAVLDIDSAVVHRFDADDQCGLEKLLTTVFVNP